MGGWLTGGAVVTVIVTLAGLLATWPSLTTSWKLRLVALAGAVKLGRALLAAASVTVGPAVCVQA